MAPLRVLVIGAGIGGTARVTACNNSGVWNEQ